MNVNKDPRKGLTSLPKVAVVEEVKEKVGPMASLPPDTSTPGAMDM